VWRLLRAACRAWFDIKPSSDLSSPYNNLNEVKSQHIMATFPAYFRGEHGQTNISGAGFCHVIVEHHPSFSLRTSSIFVKDKNFDKLYQHRYQSIK
jgi:hypothetical protein